MHTHTRVRERKREVGGGRKREREIEGGRERVIIFPCVCECVVVWVCVMCVRVYVGFGWFMYGAFFVSCLWSAFLFYNGKMRQTEDNNDNI